MKKLFSVIALAMGMVMLMSSGAAAGPSNGQVCSGLDGGKIDTTGDPESVTVTAPDGKLIDGYCVKAGSANQDDGGPVYVDIEPVKTVTIKHPSGKDVSHYSVSYTDVTTTTTTTPSTTVPPTTTPPTTEPPVTTVPPTTEPPVPPVPDNPDTVCATEPELCEPTDEVPDIDIGTPDSVERPPTAQSPPVVASPPTEQTAAPTQPVSTAGPTTPVPVEEGELAYTGPSGMLIGTAMVGLGLLFSGLALRRRFAQNI